MQKALAPEISTWPQAAPQLIGSFGPVAPYKGPTGKDFVPFAFTPQGPAT